MMLKRNAILVIVGAAVLGVLSLMSLAAVVGLGIAGILEAKNRNPCERSNGTDCMFSEPLDTNLNNSEP
ncbi:hypothetical protein GBAR_LOCUS2705, partial [Geodia barretti]